MTTNTLTPATPATDAANTPPTRRAAAVAAVHADAPDTEEPEILVHLGGMDKRVAYALDRFKLPRLPLAALAIAREAIDTALATSQAVVITGPRGAGKTYAVRCLRQAFDAAQAEATLLNPEEHRPDLTAYFTRLTGRTLRENLLTMLRAISPALAREREVGARIADDELGKRVALELRRKRYRLLIVDEGEAAPDSVIEVLRRVLADTAPDDTEADARAEGMDLPRPSEEGHYPGLGIVLVGTPSLADRLRATDDRNGRWSRFLEVPALLPDEVPSIYETVFPGFRAAIASMGRPAWEALVAERIVRNRRLSMRQVRSHCRLYFALLYDASLRGPAERVIVEREQVPLDEHRFVYAFTQLDSDGPRPVVGELRIQRKRGRTSP